MKKTLKFDYIPVMRESIGISPLVSSGDLKDRFNIYWNSDCVFKDIDPVTETFEKGLVQRETTVELNNKKDNIWSLLFNYDLSNFNKTI